ncbi:MAG: LysR family transcriptional regulator [Pseudomonadota bacterium]
MDWDKLRIFHAAAQAGSFTHAGDILHLSQSAISRQVSALEKDLSTPLFHRHARGLALTEQGELLFDTVDDVMNKLHTVEMLLADSKDRPTGDLKITAPVGLGTTWLTPRLREFLDLHPDIRIELILNDEQIDIAMRAADVAIWLQEPEQSDLIRRRLFSMVVHPFASASYVRRNGAPQTIADLKSHRIVSYAGLPAQHLSAITWLENIDNSEGNVPAPIFRVNSVVAMKEAIRSGIGIGMLPDYLADGEGELLPVLKTVEPPTLPILYVYPAELKASKKVQLLRDFLVSKARSWRH